MKTSVISSLTIRVCMCVVIISTLFSACKKDRNDNSLPAAPDVNFVALTADNKIMLLNARSGLSAGQMPITGLQASESLLAIDFRPASGELYGLGSTSRIYAINFKTGVARAIGAAPFTPAISGTAVGFDFNPTVDRIRVVTSTGQNLRINPETGAVAFVDGTVTTASKITSVAYTENRAGAATTALFDIDVTNNKLYKQDPPNDGTLTEIGSLNVDAEDAGGFDISPDGSVALAALTVSGQSGLFTIDLATGAATKVGQFGTVITGIAIPTDPIAYVVNENNELVIYNPNSGTTVLKPITGLQTGENVLGIDTRPVNGQLYILGSSSRLYTLNAATGGATAVGTAAFATPLEGTDFGFDFNPTVDRIRIISNTGQNLRAHPETGVIAAVDAPLNPGTPSVTAAAYTNNFAGATTTVLFDIDSETNLLYKQDPPNNGTLVTVGPLNVDVTAANGFDIGSTSGFGYAMLTTSAGVKFYSIDLNTGRATAGAAFTSTVRGFTIGLGF
ncbi:MAG: DUF4394 domain-containing protein [Mucilaginibacter sp.]